MDDVALAHISGTMEQGYYSNNKKLALWRRWQCQDGGGGDGTRLHCISRGAGGASSGASTEVSTARVRIHKH